MKIQEDLANQYSAFEQLSGLATGVPVIPRRAFDIGG